MMRTPRFGLRSGFSIGARVIAHASRDRRSFRMPAGPVAVIAGAYAFARLLKCDDAARQKPRKKLATMPRARRHYITPIDAMRLSADCRCTGRVSQSFFFASRAYHED